MFLGEKKLPCVSVGISKLVHQFDSALREVKESKGYKKYMAHGTFIDKL